MINENNIMLHTCYNRRAIRSPRLLGVSRPFYFYPTPLIFQTIFISSV
jgi:hypothetical protein